MKPQKFKTILVRDQEPGGWTKLDLPFDVEKSFGGKGYIPVKGWLDHVSFQGIKIMPVGNGRYQMAVSEKLRRAIGKGHHDTVAVIMEPDLETTTWSEPPDFMEALSSNLNAMAFYQTLTPAAKKWFIVHIGEARQEATRKRRIEKALERLAAGKKFHD